MKRGRTWSSGWYSLGDLDALERVYDAWLAEQARRPARGQPARAPEATERASGTEDGVPARRRRRPQGSVPASSRSE